MEYDWINDWKIVEKHIRKYVKCNLINPVFQDMITLISASLSASVFTLYLCNLLLQPISNADFIVPVEIDGTVHQVTWSVKSISADRMQELSRMILWLSIVMQSGVKDMKVPSHGMTDCRDWISASVWIATLKPVEKNSIWKDFFP